MDFNVTETARYPRERVFRAHRDEFCTIAARMPEVSRVTRRSRSAHADGTIEQVHRWNGAPAALPMLLRPLVPVELLEWDDESRWNPHSWRCDWKILVPGLGPMADIYGSQTYEETKAGCRMTLSGHFNFHPERVPKLTLPPGARPIIERFIVGLIVPLLKKSGKAIVAHLDAQKS